MSLFSRAKEEINAAEALTASLRRVVASPVAPQRAAGPKPEQMLALSAEEQAEYARAAAAVGFVPGGLIAEAMRLFLSESGILVYPMPKVHAYLTGQYGAEKKDEDRSSWTGMVATWVWHPLRSADQNESATNWDARRQTRHSKNGSVAREQSVYGKPLPLPVLLTVEKIATRFPDALFFVSDEYHAPPIMDPFLMVLYGGEQFVVERWDEPSFRA